jgi:DNA-binding beta-propeller fold protein YncE
MKLLACLATSLLACSSDVPCDPDAPNTICTIAGSGEQGMNGEGGPATSAALYTPMDTAVSPDGDVWILDFNNYVIRVIDGAGNIHTVIGNGQVGDSPDAADGGVTSMPAINARFNHTTDLFFHDGYVYVSAWHSSRIKRVRLSDMMIENYAGRGVRTFYDGDDGPAMEAALDLPSSIARDRNNNIVIMDQANQVVRMIDSTGMITRIVGKCVIDDQPCAVPQPCPGSNKLACGDLATECGKACTPGYGGDGGPATEARLNQPFLQWADPAGRIQYDNAGHLYIADTDNNRIRRVDAVTNIITTVAGIGEPGFSGEGVLATEAMINRPVDIVFADDNTMYFTDVYNACVRKVDPAGIISTVVGRCSEDPNDRGFSGDGGPPLEARLDRPYGIDLHGTKLYVTDSYNNRIRVVNLP